MQCNPASLLFALSLLVGCKESLVAKSYLAVVHVSPTGGAVNVGVETDVIAVFSEALNADSVSPQNAYLEDADAAPIITSLVWDEDALSVTLSPETALSPDTTYVAHFTTGLQGSRSGALLATVSSQFSTAGWAPINELPVADAGTDQDVEVGQSVQLDGSESQDPEGASLTYLWRGVAAPSGTTSILDDPTSATPSFTPDLEGVYSYGLTVNDGSQDSSEAFVQITALGGGGGEDTGGNGGEDTGGNGGEDTGGDAPPTSP